MNKMAVKYGSPSALRRDAFARGERKQQRRSALEIAGVFEKGAIKRTRLASIFGAGVAEKTGRAIVSR